MGNYSVPESIRKYKPKGTMVKVISGHYYVYEFTTVKGEDGKRHTKMGKSLGTIKEGIGFIPNNNLISDPEVSTLEFGEYAVVLANSRKTFELLNACFNPEDAVRIYVTAMIQFIQGFTYMKDIRSYYEMSILSLKYPSLKLGDHALSSFYDNLGRRQENVLHMEEMLIAACSKQVAIDGHVIDSCSAENDLAEKGYKFLKMEDPQLNLLMAYDVNTGTPLLSRIYSGALPDKVSVRDFMGEVEMKEMLFIVDRGFYSAENLKICSSHGNSYIIPLAGNLTACRKAAENLALKNRFAYRKGRKGTVVEYKDEMIDGSRVLMYRDLEESVLEQTNYLRYMEQGHRSYTQENFEKLKDFMGVIVLQTNINASDKTAEEIYALYKKRRTAETFYNYFKNKADCRTLYMQDYYKTQGLAFIMLVSALIHREFEEAVKGVKGRSVQDCLLDARMVKASKRHGVWCACNCGKKQQDLFQQLNTPMIVPI